MVNAILQNYLRKKKQKHSSFALELWFALRKAASYMFHVLFTTKCNLDLFDLAIQVSFT